MRTTWRATTTGEPDGKYPPTFKVKIPNYDGRWGCDIYDDKKNELKPTPEELKELIGKGSKVQALIRCTGVYFAAGKFGVTWRVTQLKVFRNNTLKGYAFVDDSDDDNGIRHGLKDGHNNCHNYGTDCHLRSQNTAF